MTKEEIIKDLKYKLDDYGYFNQKLFEDDHRVFERRSFGDLLKYYQEIDKNISEELLINSLKEADFQGKICSDLHKIVFFIIGNGDNSFLIDDDCGYLCIKDENVKDKYTPTYIMDLLND